MTSITVLQCAPGHSASKVWRRAGLQGFDAGWLFAVEQYGVASIHDLAQVLLWAERTTDRLVIRGVPVPGLDLARPTYRRSRSKPGEPASFEATPRLWAMLDFDALELPFDFSPLDPEQAVRHVLGRLPPCFSGVTVFWQLGSKAGMVEPRALSVHLWFWLDRALGDAELEAWSDGFDVEVDATLFRTVQPHYVCAPRFEDGLVDPLSRRSGLLVGPRDDVPVPALPPKPRRVFAPAGGGTAHYETDMRLLGDGPGRKGFYRPILQGVWDYVVSGRRDFAWLKEDIRRQVELAPAKESRSDDYLERICSDEELERFIEGALAKVEPPEPVTREALERTARNLKRSKDARRQDLGAGLEQIAKGCAPDGGTPVILRLAETLAEPHVDAASLASLFGHALQVAPGAPTVDGLRAIIEAAQASARERTVAADLAQDAEARRRIREAFGDGRDWPYTEAELEGIAADARCARADFSHRWILQYRKQFYVYFLGAYQGPIAAEELAPRALTFLAPASSAGVLVEGKTTAELMAAYGSPATRVVTSMCESWSRFDAATHTLIEAVCPVRALAPTFDPLVDTWLRLLGGAKAEQLLDWIAASTRLDRPCPALFLRGPTGNGKSLLAAGLARQWCEGAPTDLESAMSDFNSAILDCPLAFGDERVPKDTRGNPRTEELRELISRSEHSLRRKHVAESTVRGAIRVILAANNLNLLAIPGELTNQDIAAIGERFLYIELQDQDYRAALFLAAHGGREFTEQLVQGDRIARHALWLRDARPRLMGGRWAVPGDCAEMLRAMRTGAGLRWPLCKWLVAWLMDGAATTPTMFRAPGAVLVRDRKVYASVDKIRESWTTYLKDEQVPATQKVQKAFAEISTPGEEGRRQFRLKAGPSGGRVWMREIPTEYLLTWSALHDGPPAAEIQEAIERAEARDMAETGGVDASVN